MAGRPHVPTQLKIAAGTENVSRLNPREPQLPPRVPEPPDHLDELELAAWRQLTAVLDPMRVTTAADAAAFEVLVTTLVQHQKLNAALRKHGDLTYATEKRDGGTMLRVRPELAALGDLRRLLLVLLGRFGLTPSDRAKVAQAPPSSGDDPDDEFKR